MTIILILQVRYEAVVTSVTARYSFGYLCSCTSRCCGLNVYKYMYFFESIIVLLLRCPRTRQTRRTPLVATVTRLVLSSFTGDALVPSRCDSVSRLFSSPRYECVFRVFPSYGRRKTGGDLFPKISGVSPQKRPPKAYLAENAFCIEFNKRNGKTSAVVLHPFDRVLTQIHATGIAP